MDSDNWPTGILIKTARNLLTFCRNNAMASIDHKFGFIMAALRSRCGHYIFALWFFSIFYLLSSFFIPRLISAAADWMSTILLHMAWPSANLECRSEMCCWRLAANTGRKKVAKNRHLSTIAQLRWAISSQLRHVSTIGKNWLSTNTSSIYVLTIW